MIADIQYLAQHSNFGHEKMNALIEPLDAKTTLALDGHSIFFLLQEDRGTALARFAPYLGPVVSWCSGSQPIGGYWGTWSYDHSIFTNAVAASVLYSGALTDQANATAKYVRINPLPASYFTAIGRVKAAEQRLLKFSLEAHQRDYNGQQFWIGETYSAVSDTAGANATPVGIERIRNLEQVELRFEGGPNVLNFPFRWNKFHKFRIHKLDAGNLTLNFLSSTGTIAHTVVVPGYGSRCVRRVKNNAGEYDYVDGYNYFQKFIAGDIRFYQATNAAGFGDSTINPGGIIPFVNFVLAGQSYKYDGVNPSRFAAPTVLLDPRVRAPLPPGYETLYGDVTNDATKLGDGLHHRGQVIDVQTTFGDPNHVVLTRPSFTGYGNLGNMPGFTFRTVGNDLQVKSSDGNAQHVHDFISLSTNFLCTGDSSFITSPVRDASTFSNIDRHMPSTIVHNKFDLTNTPASLNYTLVTAGGNLGAVQTVTIQRAALSPSANYPVSGLLPHVDTVATAKSKLTVPTANCSFSSTSMKLTSSSLVLEMIQTIPLSAPLSIGADVPVYGHDEVAEYNLIDQLTKNVIAPLSSDLRQHIEYDGQT